MDLKKKEASSKAALKDRHIPPPPPQMQRNGKSYSAICITVLNLVGLTAFTRTWPDLRFGSGRVGAIFILCWSGSDQVDIDFLLRIGSESGWISLFRVRVCLRFWLLRIGFGLTIFFKVMSTILFQIKNLYITIRPP